MSLRVNEIFSSIQGEGRWAGTPATFVRLQGCDVGCKWCDTKYAMKFGGGTVMEEIDIFKQIEHHHVVITGGEPLHQDLDKLIELLEDGDCFSQVETSGVQWFVGDKLPDWITLSPKAKLDWKFPFKFWLAVDEWKFVVDNDFHIETLKWVKSVVDKNILTSIKDDLPQKYYYLMPEGCPPSKELVDRTILMLHELRFHNRHDIYYGDRLQWRLGIR